jgi:meiosis induction protein kinase IME2/SME1
MGSDPSTLSVSQRTRAWAEDAGRMADHPQSPGYDGSVFEGSEPSASNASFSQLNLSQNALASRSQSRVSNYIQAQQHLQAYASEPVRPVHPVQHAPPPQPPIEHKVNASSVSVNSSQGQGKLLSVVSGKKKKWGMSNIFGGGGDKSSTTLPPVEEVTYTGGSSSSLKRTQSGNSPASRDLPMPTLAPPVDDPKQAKKEAERAKKEAEKLKREAAARMQKERARAVMMKRQHMMQTQPVEQLEYQSGFADKPEKSKTKSRDPAGIYSSASPTMGSSRDVRSVSALPPSNSVTSVHSQSHHSERSHHSIHSGQSRSHPQLPSTVHPAYELGGRHKARRRDEDDDHSMSSFDHNSLRSRSVLTVGTIDSE